MVQDGRQPSDARTDTGGRGRHSTALALYESIGFSVERTIVVFGKDYDNVFLTNSSSARSGNRAGDR